jgi:hypothetical protein
MESPNTNFHKYISLLIVLGLLHRMVVDNIADVSEAHAASIFRIEMHRLVTTSRCNNPRLKLVIYFFIYFMLCHY